MDIYGKLIENPLFFKWIYYPTQELESYWDVYLKQNPDQSSKILEFKGQFEKYLKHENKNLSESEKKKLAEEIISKLQTVKTKKQRKIYIKTWMRYAAVALLFFSIGSSLVYLYMEPRQPIFVMQNATVPAHAQDPVLIIGDGQEIKLSQGKSKLDYSSHEEIVIDREKKLDKKSNGKAPEINTLVIPYGNSSFITLADGTKVWLNAGSRLIYPSEFIDKNREVFLVGEAYFEVDKNENQPFVVRTPDIKVNVLGTKFNISAYPENYSVQTVLAEGSVKIGRADAGLFEKDIVIEPGQMAYFNKKSKETNIYNVEVENYTLWTQGLLSFTNTDLNRIVKKLERYYNLRIQFEDPLQGSIQITGKLDINSNQLEVFEYLSKLTGLEFIKVNNYEYTIK